MEQKELLNFINIFREMANSDKLIVFVGAGVSCNAEGMPDWNELIRKMAESIHYAKCTTCRQKDDECHKTCKFKDTFSTCECTM